jgi:hypothetical protein
MAKAELARTVAEVLEPFLRQHGFGKQDDLHYVRDAGCLRYDIGFALTKAQGAVYQLFFGVGIRVPEFVTALDLLGEGPEQARFGQPIYALRPVSRGFYWPVATPSDVRKCGGEIRADVVEYAIPFLSRFTKAQDVVESLRSPSGEWFGNPPDFRHAYCVLWELCVSGPDAALDLGNRLLQGYRGQRPNRSFRLREVVRTIAEKREKLLSLPKTGLGGR